MNIISLEEVDSTNLYAKQNLDSLEDRTIIVAKNQTSGEGDLIDLGLIWAMIIYSCLLF